MKIYYWCPEHGPVWPNSWDLEEFIEDIRDYGLRTHDTHVSCYTEVYPEIDITEDQDD